MGQSAYSRELDNLRDGLNEAQAFIDDTVLNALILKSAADSARSNGQVSDAEWRKFSKLNDTIGDVGARASTALSVADAIASSLAYDDVVRQRSLLDAGNALNLGLAAAAGALGIVATFLGGPAGASLT